MVIILKRFLELHEIEYFGKLCGLCLLSVNIILFKLIKFICRAALGLQKIEQMLRPIPIYPHSLCPVLPLLLTSCPGVAYLPQLMNQY